MKVRTLFVPMLLWFGLCWAVTGCGGSGAASPPSPPPLPSSITVSISPKSVDNLPAGGTQVFTAIVFGSTNQAVTWSVQEGATGGTITSTGVYTAPQVPGTYHVVASSIADSTKSSTAQVTVPPISVAISPRSTSLARGETVTFTATVTGSLNNAVTWSVLEGAAGGTISNTGVYVAPNTLGTFHVVATSQADSSKSAVAPVTVNPVAVTIDPAADTLGPGGVRAFTAFVTGATNTAVIWSVLEGAVGGSITSDGLYTAPATLATYHVIATSVADPTQSATAPVIVVASGFRPTGNMATGRENHTATLLNTGNVLVAGGFTRIASCCATTSVVLFYPVAETFAPTGSMATARITHTATLLKNGKVLVAGGFSVSSITPTAELYDPATGAFTPTGSMGTARAGLTATLLKNGKVFAARGDDCQGPDGCGDDPLASCCNKCRENSVLG